MQNALTIDLEDWYQGLTSTAQQIDRWPDYERRVVENTHRLLAILDEAGVTATFFVLGYVADEFPELVREVKSAGHEIGLHGYFHRQVFRLQPEEFRDDVERGRAAVENASGVKVAGYRAPMFSVTRSSLWALEVLAELGFRYDSSVFATRNMLYGYPGAPRAPYHPLNGDRFVEFPLATVRILGRNWPVAGGFYLRALPYAIFKRGVQRINAEGKPAVIYLHPWDLDVGQPYPNPTLRERFTHYYNLRTTAAKLQALLRDFAFGPLVDLLHDEMLSGVMEHAGNPGIAAA
jgi:polysaccharide deacetylase family protein (PEP-CTERM system associated)